MERLRRSFRESFRRRKDHVPESSKPHQWQSDEAAVRAGTCNFYVKVHDQLSRQSGWLDIGHPPGFVGGSHPLINVSTFYVFTIGLTFWTVIGPLQYLGCVEVYESRGMPVCEEALKVLRVNFPFIAHT